MASRYTTFSFLTRGNLVYYYMLLRMSFLLDERLKKNTCHISFCLAMHFSMILFLRQVILSSVKTFKRELSYKNTFFEIFDNLFLKFLLGYSKNASRVHKLAGCGPPRYNLFKSQLLPHFNYHISLILCLLHCMLNMF